MPTLLDMRSSDKGIWMLWATLAYLVAFWGGAAWLLWPWLGPVLTAVVHFLRTQ